MSLTTSDEISLPRDAHVLAGAWEANLAAAAKHARCFRIFRHDPFDPRLRPHKIQSLSARYGRIIYAVEIEADLRAVFYVERDVVMTLDIGSHAIYR